MSLQFFRSKTFMMVVMVALFAGLAWFSADYDTRGGSAGSACLIKVYGKCYREQDVRRLVSYFEVARDLLLVDFALSLFGEDREDRDPTDFVTNLLVLRHEAAAMGIEPTDEEAKQAIRSSPIFGAQTWINDDILVSNVLSPRGLTKADLIQLGKDYLCWRKLGDLLEAGNNPVPLEVDKAYVRRFQQFTASLAEFPIASYQEKAAVTEEEIQKYYEENKANLLSEEKRGVTMIKFSPPAETPEMTNEQKSQQRFDFNNKVNEIYASLAEDESRFADLAKKIAADPANGFPITIEEIAPFPGTTPPEALKDGGEILNDLFSPARTAEPGRSVTIPYAREDGNYLMFRVTQILEPAPLTLEEAKDQIKTVLTNQKANQLVNEAATAARAKLLEAVESGQSVADAAKAAGVELKPLPAFSESEPPAGIDAAGQVVAAAIDAGPKSVSEVLSMPLGKGYRLVVVEKAELVESDQIDTRKSSIRIGAASDYRRALYQAWFRKRLADSGATRSGPVVSPDQEGEADPSGPANS